MQYGIDTAQLNAFSMGKSTDAYKTLGCHNVGPDRWRFAVWAPNARAVSVVGDFNGWDAAACPMEPVGYGVYAALVEGDIFGWPYKYHITTQSGEALFKADPYAFYSELRPGTASRVFGLDGYEWGDGDWLRSQEDYRPYERPVNIYEVHLPSFKGEMNYRDLAEELIPYVAEMGYTHVEFMPVSEYPFDGSWGYQPTGFFAVTARGGNPHDFMYLVDRLHQHGIGVIVDWVAGHFPRDAQGLRLFDGTPLYEYGSPLEGEHPDWGTMVFDYGRNEVVSFLVSSAVFWQDVYHIDGLRADAVSSMLYKSYGRKEGEWIPNRYGGAENLEAIELIRSCARALFARRSGFIFAAEESTAFPLVTAPIEDGGLGFNYKWNMGWMNDMLEYMELDPYFRQFHHDKLTFSMHYAFSENYILPLSHDEVVHGKKSLLDKMPGDYDQKFANLRALFAYMYAHPGKKLLFMGGEIGQFIEWRYYEPIEWKLLAYDRHAQLQRYVRELNLLYCRTPALHALERSWEGFEWLNADDAQHSVIAFARSDGQGGTLVCAFNFTPVEWWDYRLGVQEEGLYHEVFNSDAAEYGGGGHANERPIPSEEEPWNGREHSIVLKLPPLGAVYLSHRPRKQAKKPTQPAQQTQRTEV